MRFQSFPCRTAGAAHFVLLAVMAVAILAGGCSASPNGPSRVAGPTVPISGEPAPLPAWLVQTAKAEVEADGYPVQLALRTRPAAPDDPREPWSPNYGTAQSFPAVAQSPSATVAAAAAQLAATASRDSWPTLKIVPRPVDPDDVIRRAIAEHEMRQ